MTIASVWPVPYRLTCSIAASSDRTTATRHLQVEELAAEVVVGGGAHRGPRAPRRRRRRRARRPCSASASATRGRNASATASCTRSDSAALHTLGPLRLRVHDDVERLVEVGGRVDVDVAVAVAVDDHRHGRVVADARDERGAAARDQAVDVVGELHHLDGGLVARRRRRGCTASSGSPALASASRRTAAIAMLRAQRRARAAQQRGVAGLEAEPGGVAGHVGPVLVDDRHHAERHPDLLRSGGRWAGRQPSSISPTGSGSAATWRSPAAMPSMRAVGEPEPVERTRLHAAGSAAASRSTTLAARISAARSTSRSAAVCSAAFFASVDAVASRREATLARRASSFTASDMREEHRWDPHVAPCEKPRPDADRAQRRGQRARGRPSKGRSRAGPSRASAREVPSLATMPLNASKRTLIGTSQEVGVALGPRLASDRRLRPQAMLPLVSDRREPSNGRPSPRRSWTSAGKCGRSDHKLQGTPHHHPGTPGSPTDQSDISVRC